MWLDDDGNPFRVYVWGYSPQLLFWNQLLLYFSLAFQHLPTIERIFYFNANSRKTFPSFRCWGENIKAEEKEIFFQYCLLPKHFPFLSFYSIHDFIEQDFTFLIITEDDRHVDGRTKRVTLRGKDNSMMGILVAGKER